MKRSTTVVLLSVAASTVLGLTPGTAHAGICEYSQRDTIVKNVGDVVNGPETEVNFNNTSINQTVSRTFTESYSSTWTGSVSASVTIEGVIAKANAEISAGYAKTKTVSSSLTINITAKPRTEVTARRGFRRDRLIMTRRIERQDCSVTTSTLANILAPNAINITSFSERAI